MNTNDRNDTCQAQPTTRNEKKDLCSNLVESKQHNQKVQNVLRNLKGDNDSANSDTLHRENFIPSPMATHGHRPTVTHQNQAFCMGMHGCSWVSIIMAFSEFSDAALRSCCVVHFYNLKSGKCYYFVIEPLAGMCTIVAQVQGLQ
jgi:hypothetical protein